MKKNEDEQMYIKFIGYIDVVENKFLKDILNKMFIKDTKMRECFKNAKGGGVHHSYQGGLLEHSFNVVKICEFYTTIFDDINKDLLITAAMLHDVGKVIEYYNGETMDYIDEGKLLGHIVIGFDQVSKIIATIEDFPLKIENELKHCLVAHHGELECGSPQRPALLEAAALYYADTADSKLKLMTEIFDTNMCSGQIWTGYNSFFNSDLKKTSKCETL